MSIRTKMLELIEASPHPITSKQIAETLNVRIETVASALTDLWKSKAVKRRGTEREGERGGRLYEYVHSSSTLEGFESLVLPLAKKAGKKTAKHRERVTTSAMLPQATTIIATVSIPVNGKALTLTVREARQLYEQLSALFIGVGAIQGAGHVAHQAA